VPVPDVYPATFPTKEGEPNDDSPGFGDEQNSPVSDHIYSTDAPGSEDNIADAPRKIWRFNFDEFVRVHVNGNSFVNQNGVREDSRCSDYIAWRSRIDAVDSNPPTYVFTRNAAGENEIELGHKSLGQPPVPTPTM
jgi:hypothetical protein